MARQANASLDAAPFEAVDLRGLGLHPCDSLALFCFADVRPMHGLAALIDWRLGGRLSAALRDGSCHGAAGEQVMVPTFGRLGQRRLFLFGLGDHLALTEPALGEIQRQAVETMKKAGGEAMGLVVPQLPSDTAQLTAVFLRLAAPLARQQGVRVLTERLP